MGISTKLAERFEVLSSEQKKKLVRLALSDKISFQEIQKDFNFSPGQVEKFMRSELSENGFIRWQKRRNKKFNQKSRKARLLKGF